MLYNGILLIVISLIGISLQLVKKDNAKGLRWEKSSEKDSYSRIMDAFYYRSLYLILFLIGVLLVYNSIATKYSWPILF